MRHQEKHSASGWLVGVASRLYEDPRLIALALLLAIGAGVFAFLKLPRMEDPPLAQRAMTITTLLPGADAEQVEATVTQKIENQLLDIPDLKLMRSQSRAGASWISFEVADSVVDTDPVWTRVRAKVEESLASLPPGASRPRLDETEVSAYAWIGAVVWQSNTTPSHGILRRLALRLEDRLRAVAGTKDVDLFGEPQEEIVVRIDQAKAASLGISVEEIAAKLNGADAKESVGNLHGPQTSLVVQMGNRFRTLEEIANASIRESEQGVLQLGDLASITRQIRRPEHAKAIVDGRPAVVVGAFLDPSVAIGSWTEAADASLQEFQSHLPSGVSLEPLLIQRDYVSARMATLWSNLAIGTVAVSLVTLVFMGWRAAGLVTMTLPLASLLVLAGMYLLGVPIHQMSVTGLVLALGLLIDNAIISVDEVTLALRSGLSRIEAMRKTVARLSAPLLGSTVTTALAFAPLALMKGSTGEFIGSIGITVILAISSSMLLSVTILPALAAQLLPRSLPHGQAGHPWFVASVFQRGLQLPKLTAGYRSFLHWMVLHPRHGMALGAALPIAGFLGAGLLEEQFFPPSDRNQIQIEVELGSSAPIARTEAVTREVEKLLRQTPQVHHVHWFLGESAPSFYYNLIPLRKNTPSYAQGIVQVHGSQLDEQWLTAMQAKLNEAFLDARVTIRKFEQGPPVNAPIEVRIYGHDLARLQHLGRDVHRRLAGIPEVLHVRSDLNEVRPIAEVDVEAFRARKAQLEEATIGAQLFSQLEGLPAGSILEATEEVPVRVCLDESRKSTLLQLQNAAIHPSLPGYAHPQRGVQGTTSLSALAEISLTPQFASITHMNGERVNEVQGYLEPDVLPAQVLSAFQSDLKNSPLNLPADFRVEFGGEAAERANAITNLLSHAPLLGLMMLGALVLALGSFRLTAVIGSVGLLSIGIGCGSLWLFGFPFGFTAIVGTVGLVGVAINDSIVVLTALKDNPQARTGDAGAIVETVVECTRHVLCTTFTTMFGFVPLVVWGGDFWPPLAIVIGSGIVGATLLAITYMPSLFVCWAESPSLANTSPPNAELAPVAQPNHDSILIGGFAPLPELEILKTIHALPRPEAVGDRTLENHDISAILGPSPLLAWSSDISRDATRHLGAVHGSKPEA